MGWKKRVRSPDAIATRLTLSHRPPLTPAGFFSAFGFGFGFGFASRGGNSQSMMRFSPGVQIRKVLNGRSRMESTKMIGQ